MKLSGKQASFLRGRGHRLKPVVTIGKHGLSDAALAQIEECLLAQELMKVKLLESSPVDKKDCAAQITKTTGAVVAQSVGRVLLIYRPHPENPVLAIPN